MTRLSQIIGVERGVQAHTAAELAAITRDATRTQKDGPLQGLSATYERLYEDDPEVLPSESTKVQFTVTDLLDRTTIALGRLLDVRATVDWANQTAQADVVIDGTVILPDVPVTYLLFLDKQLTALRTLIKGLPTLDPGETWTYREDVGCYASEPVQTKRTKRIPRAHVMVEATEHHPAQVRPYEEDKIVGTWTRVKFSGALPAERVRLLLRRVDALHEAVTFAREEANTKEVADQKVAKHVFGYLFVD